MTEAIEQVFLDESLVDLWPLMGMSRWVPGTRAHVASQAHTGVDCGRTEQW